MAFRTEALHPGSHNQPYVHATSEPKVRAVVIDDLSSMLEAICAVLEFGDLVEIVGRGNNGAEAVQLAAELHPDLVLMDVRMPGMNGLQASRFITDHLPDVRVVLMSAEDALEIREQALACGADEFIPKLGFPGELVPALRRLFPRPEPGAEHELH